jgi:hypothetical protein
MTHKSKFVCEWQNMGLVKICNFQLKYTVCWQATFLKNSVKGKTIPDPREFGIMLSVINEHQEQVTLKKHN